MHKDDLFWCMNSWYPHLLVSGSLSYYHNQVLKQGLWPMEDSWLTNKLTLHLWAVDFSLVYLSRLMSTTIYFLLG